MIAVGRDREDGRMGGGNTSHWNAVKERKCLINIRRPSVQLLCTYCVLFYTVGYISTISDLGTLINWPIVCLNSQKYMTIVIVGLICMLFIFVGLLQADQLIQLLNSKGETNWSLCDDPLSSGITQLKGGKGEALSPFYSGCCVGWYTAHSRADWCMAIADVIVLNWWLIYTKTPLWFVILVSKLCCLISNEAKWIFLLLYKKCGYTVYPTFVTSTQLDLVFTIIVS